MQGYATVSNASDTTGVGTFNNYNNRANELMGYGMLSPFSIEPTLTLNEEGLMVVSANVEVVGAEASAGATMNSIRGTQYFLPGDNKIYFIITETDPNDIRDRAYRNRVVYFHSEDFTLTTNGATESYTYTSNLPPKWGLENYTAVVYIQRMHVQSIDEMGVITWATPIIYQVESAKFAETVFFKADVTMGFWPFAAAFDNLTNISGPATYTWDFGDGSAPLIVTNPWAGPGEQNQFVERVTHRYNIASEFDVSLTISRTGLPDVSFTRNAYIHTVGNEGTELYVFGDLVGTIPSNTTLNVTGDVIVPANGHLIIRSGSTINVSHGVKFVVNGTLDVRGTPENPVLFTSTTSWDGIHFSGNVSDPLITFEHAIFEKSTGAIRASQRTLHIMYCEFRDNVAAAAANAPAIDLTTSGTTSGADNAGLQGPWGPTIIKGCFFTRNRSGVVQIDKSVVRIINCVFANNTGNSSGAILLKFMNKTHIENCTFYNNQYTGAVGGTITLIGSTALTAAPDVTMINSIIEGSPPIHIGDVNSRANIAYSAYIDNRATGTPSNRITFGAGMLYKSDFQYPDNNIFVSPSSGVGHLFTTLRDNWILHEDSICIDAGHPGVQYNDREDEENPGNPLSPALGTLRNDMGAFGGDGFHSDITEPSLPVVVWGKIFYRLPGQPADFPAYNPTIIMRGGELGVPLVGTYMPTTGNFQIDNILPNGEYTITVTAPRADTVVRNISIGSFHIGNYNIQINYTPPESDDPILITGLLRYNDGTSLLSVTDPIIHMTCSELEEPIIGTYDPDTMVYTIADVPQNATYYILITAPGFEDFTREVVVTNSDILGLNLLMIAVQINEIEELKPHKTALYGAFPNPFNPMTTISFDMSRDEHVTIEIFNIKGQKVSTLVNDVLGAGRHSVVWYGVDDYGRNVGSGVYLYRMTTESYNSIQKMILMK
jgi:hypothetical protein